MTSNSQVGWYSTDSPNNKHICGQFAEDDSCIMDFQRAHPNNASHFPQAISFSDGNEVTDTCGVVGQYRPETPGQHSVCELIQVKDQSPNTMTGKDRNSGVGRRARASLEKNVPLNEASKLKANDQAIGKKTAYTIMRNFMNDDSKEELVFPSTLTKEERKTIHDVAEKFGLTHKSSGSSHRVLTVKKTQCSPEPESKKSLSAKQIMARTKGFQGLQRLPATRIESVVEVINDLTHPLVKRMIGEIKVFTGAAPKSYPLTMTRCGLRNIPRGTVTAERVKDLKEFRCALPSYKYKDVIVEYVRRSAVVVISGDTGCGKTTQIPQMLYDEEGLFDKNLQVICTQPRRISAISVAQRVAEERGEACGDSCGYIVRFDNNTSEKTRIIYMTTGILLRRLQTDPGLKGVSCVIVDEVHEREIETDLCLLLLRDLIMKGEKCHGNCMKLIVMSATVQPEKLVSYFSPEMIGSEVPVVMIPGTLYPVREYYLEDAHECLGLPPPSIPSSYEASRPPTVDGETNVCGGGTQTVYEEIMRNVGKESETKISFDLLLGLVRHFHRTSRDTSGSILIFLPGWSEISRLAKMIRKSELCKTLFLIRLHSSITVEEQRRAFIRPPKGFRKVVLATNIAEASITIDDIVYVIDSCFTREAIYNPEGNMMHLSTSLISKANGRQRCGRAGRCREGVCFHLLPRLTYEMLPEFQTPDILKAPLEEVCLNLKALKPTEACVDILRRGMDVPLECSVSHAVTLLKNICALTPDTERLTYVGRSLSRLPLHPLLGRMLIVASCLGVLDPIATIAAFLSSKSTPFMLPEDQKGKEKFIKFIHSIDGGRCSDHLLTLKIFDAWKRSGVDANYLCEGHVDESVLRSVSRTKSQLLHTVYDSTLLQGLKNPTKYVSRNSKNIGLVRFAALWSCYPKIASLEYAKKGDVQPHFLCWDDKFCQTFYTSALCKKRRKDLKDFAFVFYFERMLTEAGLRLHDATAVTPVEVALCLRELTLQPIKKVSPDLFSNGKHRMTPLFPFTILQDDRRRDMGVLFFDGGKKAFVTSMRVAKTIINVRDCMDYYLALSIAKARVVLFPDPLVRAIAHTVGHPLNDTTDCNHFIGSDPSNTWTDECDGPGEGATMTNYNTVPRGTDSLSDSGESAPEIEIIDFDSFPLSEEERRVVHIALGGLTFLDRCQSSS